MKSVYFIATGVSLLMTSLQSPAQEARPPAPPAPVSAPAPAAIPGIGGPLSCAYCDLRGKDLSGQNLTNANLVGSDLQGAKLAGATLDGAILVGANLTGADLSGAHLGATSNGPADLTNANLAAANLRHAVLTGAHLLFAGLEGTDFSGADLTGAVLGPQPKVGARGGRRTSFRGARMDRRFAPDAETADLQGVIWNQPKAEAAEPGPARVTCGNSDISGVTNPIYVSTGGTDGASCGASPESACKTLASALSRCTPTSCNVLAMFGQFALPTTLAFNTTTTPTGARLYGGCVASGQADAGLSSEIVAPPGGVPAISVAGINPPVLENFKILGLAAGAGRGAPGVTVQVTSQITLNNSLVVGGMGGSGAAGADEPPGVQGGAAEGRKGGTNASCSSTDGGAGSNRMAVQWDSSSAPPAASCYQPGPQFGNGCPPNQYPWVGDIRPCVGLSGLHGNTSGKDNGGSCGRPIMGVQCSSGRGNDGGAGSVGVNATCGSGGTASSNTEGSFVGANWSPGAGGTGTTGLNAGGGGGGGPGGAFACTNFLQPVAVPGAEGGGGGAGGCGGQPAPGGQQGGASFAIVAASGSVLTLNQSRVVAGRSGDGGRGGVGGDGGLGGKHASGDSLAGGNPNKGGDGGDGGVGGGGGAGAGGNGGPSAAVALVGGAKVDGTGTYYVGSSGNFGAGGAGGTSPVCPTGAPGRNTGVFGSVADILTYP